MKTEIAPETVVALGSELSARMGCDEAKFSSVENFARENRINLKGSHTSYEATADKIYISLRDGIKAWTDAFIQASQSSLELTDGKLFEGGSYETADGSYNHRVYFSECETDGDNNTLTAAGWDYLASQAPADLFVFEIAEAE